MSQILTFFAPASRKTRTELIEEFELIRTNQLAVSLLNGIPAFILILNTERQVVFGNKAFLEMMNLSEIDSMLGMRPGETLGCTAATKGSDGCGTSENCKVCDAIKSIMSSLASGSGSEEFTLRTGNSTMLHLKVTTEIVLFSEREFILFTMQDISEEKKKLLLERIFYHDILNSAHNINGMAELLGAEDTQENKDEYLGMLMKSTIDLIDEINTQRILSKGNQMEYLSQPVEINSFILYKELKTEFESVYDGRIIISLDKRSENFIFTADKVLLRRVITNMIKNAIEAEHYDGKITIGMMTLNEKGAMLWVHNQSFMSEEIQLQIFNRSFSTKGADRGLGTYSMKILTEKFMKGKISFTSSPYNGTTFIIEIPGKN